MLDFLKNIKQHIEIGKKVTVIEYSSNREFPISGVVLNLTKDGFDIEKKFDAENVSDLNNFDIEKTPIILGITSKQVLTKKLENFNKDRADFPTAFPNILQKDFYFENFYNENTCFVSICRKKVVEEIIAEYSTHKLQIIAFYLGNAYINELLPFLGNPEIVFTKTAKITLEESKISLLQTNSSENKLYHIGEEEITSKHLLSVALGLHYTNGFSEIISNKKAIGERLKVTFTNKQYFKYIGITLVSLLFLGLMINSLFFSSLLKNVNQLEQSQQLFESQKMVLTDLQNQVKLKSKLVESIQQTGFSNSSEIVSSILSDLPNSILLTEFVYQPLKKGIKKNKPITPIHNQILISGKTNDKTQFFEWIKTIETNRFVDKLSIDDFQDKTTKAANFNITITLKNL